MTDRVVKPGTGPDDWQLDRIRKGLAEDRITIEDGLWLLARIDAIGGGPVATAEPAEDCDG